MRKVVLGLVAFTLLVVGLVGCAPPIANPTILPSPTTVPTPILVPTQTDYVPPKFLLKEEERLIDQNWISPAEVKIGNFYPGARAEWDMRIHNGSDFQATFAVTYRISSSTREGYVVAPREAQDWVIIADSTPVFAPKETKEIMIALVIPNNVQNVPMKWEFWISVIAQGQGTIQTEMCSRWLVKMR